MSPLGAGERGYPDWQRIVNYDGPLLINENAVKHAATYSTARKEVSRFAYLGFYAGIVGSQGIFTFTWWSANTGGVALGQRRFVSDSEIGPVLGKFLNLGPFVEITVAIAGAGEFTVNLLTFGTNRVYPVELTPSRPVMINASHNYVGAEAFNFYPTDYFGGPLRVSVSTPAGQEQTVDLEAEYEPGKFVRVDRIKVAANTVSTVTMLAPATAWRIKGTASAAGEASVQAVPSFSGSS